MAKHPRLENDKLFEADIWFRRVSCLYGGCVSFSGGADFSLHTLIQGRRIAAVGPRVSLKQRLAAPDHGRHVKKSDMVNACIGTLRPGAMIIPGHPLPYRVYVYLGSRACLGQSFQPPPFASCLAALQGSSCRHRVSLLVREDEHMTCRPAKSRRHES